MSEGKQVTLLWDDYLHTLSHNICSFLDNNELVDVTLTCHGQEIKVHRFILSLFSPVLKQSLKAAEAQDLASCINGHDPKDPLSVLQPPLRPHQAVNLDYVTDQGSDVKYLIEFIYRGKVTLPEDRVIHLLRTAEILGIQGLLDTLQDSKPTRPETEDDSDKDYLDLADVHEQPTLIETELQDQDESTVDDTVKFMAPESGQIAECIPSSDAKGDEWENSSQETAPKQTETYIEQDVDARDPGTSTLVQNLGEKKRNPDLLKDSGKNETTGKSLDRLSGASPQTCLDEDEDDEESSSTESDSSRNLDDEQEAKGLVACKKYPIAGRPKRPILKCTKCNYKSTDSSNFKKHLEHHDPGYGSRHYVCEICSKTFRSRRGFRCHQAGHGDPARQHICSVCNFCTPQRWSLIKHMAVLHKMDTKGNSLSATLVCNQCGFQCMADHQLKAHMLRKHTLDKPFKCQQCSYSTVIKYELEKHISIRHRNERRYMCEMCGFLSQTHSGLVRHKRAHTGIKPYKCHVCGMEYADGGKFKGHVLRHSKDEKPFVCHICGHACRRKDNLRMHLKRIHGTSLEEEPNNVGVSRNTADETCALASAAAAVAVELIS